jgi:hypothetical protein
MISGTNATGLRCMQCSQTTQHHGVPGEAARGLDVEAPASCRREWRYLRLPNSREVLWRNGRQRLHLELELAAFVHPSA